MAEIPGRNTEAPEAAVSRFRLAVLCYACSIVVVAFGAVVACRYYPQGFDWTRHVISALASRKHNPGGSAWFASALALSLALLLPVAGTIRSAVGENALLRRAVGALRLGLALGILVALERLVFFHVSTHLRKAHEVLALVTFVLLYAGVTMAEIQLIRLRPSGWWRAAMLVVPLVAIGVSELVHYLSQRGIGWLDHDWRRSELPVFARFAFWQWLAAVALWVAVGHLLVVTRSRKGRSEMQKRTIEAANATT